MERKDIYDFAKNLTPEELKYFLECRCNSFSTDYREGREVGKSLEFSHRTLQASIFRYLLGIAVGIGDGEGGTDDRNAQAVACAKSISKMIKDGTLNIGYMI